MGVGYNPRIVTDGLVLCLDAANPRSAPTTAIESAVVSSVTGSGPSYNVVYTTNVSAAHVGDKVNVEKREAGAGTSSTVLSTYTYEITGLDRSLNQLTLTYESDTASLGDDSPADLPSGGGSSGSPEIAPHDIVSLWIDMKGGNNGTLTNGPTFSGDNVGGIEFDGTDDSIELSSLDTSLFSGDASLFCFLKTYTSGANSGTKSGIFGFGSSSNSHYTWNDGKIYLDTFRNARIGPITPSSVDRSTPHSLCITTKSGGQWKLYQNLNLVTSVSAQSSISMSNLRIGWDNSIGYRFEGSFYNFMLYNKELSVEEIRQNYLATKERYA